MLSAHSGVWIGPAALEGAPGAWLEVAIPYTYPEETRAALERTVGLTAGLNARISLVAVQPIPYPAAFGCPVSTHGFLVARLLELSNACPLPVTPVVVQARSREEGLRYTLRPGSTVLLAARKRWWRTAEERLARRLAAAGHRVALIYVR
ncbi:MAG TPA: hypothetical protein VKX45_13980 [Bryobacteraceae bacterium]|nr:hypothetical protein [Bryobacteraceae bacterium]